jgi:hypothetical protein
LLDRIDIQIEVPTLRYQELAGKEARETFCCILFSLPPALAQPCLERVLGFPAQNQLRLADARHRPELVPGQFVAVRFQDFDRAGEILFHDRVGVCFRGDDVLVGQRRLGADVEHIPAQAVHRGNAKDGACDIGRRERTSEQVGSFWWSRRCLLIAPVLVMFFIANEVPQSYSRRWVTPFFNVIGRRILPNAESTASFAQLGMPITPALMRRSGQLAWDQNWASFGDPALQEFRDWAYHHGKSSYAWFLLVPPVMTVQEPLRNIEALMAPKLTAKPSYYWSNSFSSILTGFVAEVIYVQKFALLWVWVSGLMFGFAFVAAVRKGEPRWFIPLILIMLAYPHAAIVWHGDPNDIGRLALQAGVHFRLGLWMLLLFAADITLIRATTARKTQQISVESESGHALVPGKV